jgi:hypothetical protein
MARFYTFVFFPWRCYNFCRSRQKNMFYWCMEVTRLSNAIISHCVISDMHMRVWHENKIQDNEEGSITTF